MNIKHFDKTKACTPWNSEENEKEALLSGHFEAIPKIASEFFYVDGAEPSGLKGSVVVGEIEATK